MRQALALVLLLACAACSGASPQPGETAATAGGTRLSSRLAGDASTPPWMLSGTRRFGPAPSGTPCGVTADYPCR